MKVKNFIIQFFGVAMLFVAMFINSATAHTLTFEEQYMAHYGWFVTNYPSNGIIELRCDDKKIVLNHVKGYRLDNDQVYVNFRNKASITTIKNTNCIVVDRSYKNTGLNALNFLGGNSAMINSIRKRPTIHPNRCLNPANFIRSIHPYEVVEYYYSLRDDNIVLIMVASDRIALRAVKNACR